MGLYPLDIDVASPLPSFPVGAPEDRQRGRRRRVPAVRLGGLHAEQRDAPLPVEARRVLPRHGRFLRRSSALLPSRLEGNVEAGGGLRERELQEPRGGGERRHRVPPLVEKGLRTHRPPVAVQSDLSGVQVRVCRSFHRSAGGVKVLYVGGNAFEHITGMSVARVSLAYLSAKDLCKLSAGGILFAKSFLALVEIVELFSSSLSMKCTICCLCLLVGSFRVLSACSFRRAFVTR